LIPIFYIKGKSNHPT